VSCTALKKELKAFERLQSEYCVFLRERETMVKEQEALSRRLHRAERELKQLKEGDFGVDSVSLSYSSSDGQSEESAADTDFELRIGNLILKQVCYFPSMLVTHQQHHKLVVAEALMRKY
jgi:hypothetical protein